MIIKKLIHKSKKLFKKYYTNDKSINECSGINIYEIDKVESFFKINIMIYDLTIEINEIIAEQKRICNENNKLILGLYENHFILNKNINNLCK